MTLKQWPAIQPVVGKLNTFIILNLMFFGNADISMIHMVTINEVKLQTLKISMVIHRCYQIQP